MNKQKEIITISTNLAEYDETAAKLEELKKFEGLEIEGLQDTAGYKKVHEARMIVANVRQNVEKIRKGLKSKVLECGRAIDTRAKELTETLLAIETPLKEKEKAIDDEKNRIKAEAERKRQELIQGRISQLLSLGCVYQQGMYHYGDIIILTSDIESERWEEILNHATQWKEAEDARKAEEERIKKEAEEKAEAERKAEQERLEAQRKEQERIAKEQAEAQAKIDAQRKAAEEAQRKEREKIESERRKIEAEKQAIEQAKAIEAARKQAAENARIEAEAKAKRAEEERKAKEKAEAEEEARQEALRPDKEKLLSYINAIRAIPEPELKDESLTKGQRLLNVDLYQVLNNHESLIKNA